MEDYLNDECLEFYQMLADKYAQGESDIDISTLKHSQFVIRKIDNSYKLVSIYKYDIALNRVSGYQYNLTNLNKLASKGPVYYDLSQGVVLNEKDSDRLRVLLENLYSSNRDEIRSSAEIFIKVREFVDTKKLREKISPYLELYFNDNWDVALTKTLKAKNAYENLDNAYKYSITILFPNIKIVNNRGESHTIRDLYVLIQMDSVYRLKPVVYGWRGTLTDEEYAASYLHSHLKAGYFSTFTNFCMGSHDNQVMNELQLLAIDYDESKFDTFLLLLTNMVAYESLEGGPHIRINRIKPTSLGVQLTGTMSDGDFKHACNYISPEDISVEINPQYIPGKDMLLNIEVKDSIKDKIDPKYVGHEINGVLYKQGTLVKKEQKSSTLSTNVATFKGLPINLKLISGSLSDEMINNAPLVLLPSVKTRIANELRTKINNLVKII